MCSRRPVLSLSALRQAFDRNAFTGNVLVTLTAQVGLLGMTIFSNAIIGRWLGPDGKGLVSLALLLPAMLNLFLGLGLPAANIYFTGSRQIDLSAIVGNAMGLALVAAGVGLGIVGGLISTGWIEQIVPGLPRGMLLLAMVSFPFGLFTSHITGVLLGLQRIVSVNTAHLARGVVVLLLTALFVIGFEWGLIGALVAALVGWGMEFAVAALMLRGEGVTFIPRWDRAVMSKTLSFGLKGYTGSVLQFFNYRLDVFVVNYFLGASGVGIYGVSVALAELLWYLPNAAGTVIFPKAAATQPEKMNLFTPRVFKTTLILTAIGAVGLALIGRPLIVLIYSEAFVSAYLPLLVLLPGVVLLGAGKVLTNEILGRGYPHYNAINSALALVLTIVLDLLLIPVHGVLGAAIASSLAYTVIFFTALIFYRTVSRKVT